MKTRKSLSLLFTISQLLLSGQSLADSCIISPEFASGPFDHRFSKTYDRLIIGKVVNFGVLHDDIQEGKKLGVLEVREWDFQKRRFKGKLNLAYCDESKVDPCLKKCISKKALQSQFKKGDWIYTLSSNEIAPEQYWTSWLLHGLPPIYMIQKTKSLENESLPIDYGDFLGKLDKSRFDRDLYRISFLLDLSSLNSYVRKPNKKLIEKRRRAFERLRQTPELMIHTKECMELIKDHKVSNTERYCGQGIRFKIGKPRSHNYKDIAKVFRSSTPYVKSENYLRVLNLLAPYSTIRGFVQDHVPYIQRMGLTLGRLGFYEEAIEFARYSEIPNATYNGLAFGGQLNSPSARYSHDVQIEHFRSSLLQLIQSQLDERCLWRQTVDLKTRKIFQRYEKLLKEDPDLTSVRSSKSFQELERLVKDLVKMTTRTQRPASCPEEHSEEGIDVSAESDGKDTLRAEQIYKTYGTQIDDFDDDVYNN